MRNTLSRPALAAGRVNASTVARGAHGNGARGRVAHGKAVEIGLLAAAIAVNWLLAAVTPSALFSYSSLLLFFWLNLLVLRLRPEAAILLLPITITRLATCVSLIAIEGGAYMPEVNRAGVPGDASASFVAFTAIFFLMFAAVYAVLEAPLTAFARSALLDRVVALLAAPVVVVCLLWGALAFMHGAASGFPLLEGVDRFHYRRFFSNPAVLLLLDNKYLVSALLGTVAFHPARAAVLRYAAIGTFLAMTVLYLLFGDKFFTILTEIAFFAMPFLLQRRDRLLPLTLRLGPFVLALIAGGLALNVYVFSDYGRAPLERGIERVGERFAEQGELWYVASRDYRRPAEWNASLVSAYVAGLDDDVPAKASLRNGVETYYFIQRYAPAKLAESFQKNQGWVQLTMGTEAMALVMFGYVGVAVLMVICGAVMALSAVYLRRALLSAFPLSLFFAVWTYLQVYFAVQQASLWPVAAPGQINRFLLFFVIEVLLFALNRVQGHWTPLQIMRWKRLRAARGPRAAGFAGTTPARIRRSGLRTRA